MASFFGDLWSSIFTPGTTPTLIVATNVTFAALQALLLTLLVATQSIHFAILTVLCGGLWWSINWFATELKAAQAKEDEAEKLRKRKKGESEWRRKGEVDDSADDEGEDTEVEDAKTGMRESTSSIGPSSAEREDDSRIREEIKDAMKGPEGASSSGLVNLEGKDIGSLEVRRRNVEDVDRSGEISTDSEWEKVSQQSDS